MYDFSFTLLSQTCSFRQHSTEFGNPNLAHFYWRGLKEYLVVFIEIQINFTYTCMYFIIACNYQAL